MIDIIELMEIFNLHQKPYVNLGVEWCRDGAQIYFIEDGSVYGAVFDKVVGSKDNVTCIMHDVEQFLGWEPALFSTHLEISLAEFEEKYGDLM